MPERRRAATPGARPTRRGVPARTAGTARGRPAGSAGGRGRVAEWAGIAGRLTPRDRWLLRMLLEHGVLTTPQLVQLGFASPRMTQQRLRALHTLGLTDRFQPFTAAGANPLHHVLGPVGARVIAAEEGIDPAQLRWRHDRALAIAHRRTLAHDTGTTDLVCAIATDLAATPGIALTSWWSEQRCARYFGHHTRPDTYLAVTLHPQHPAPVDRRPCRAGRVWEAFLEYDTGSEPLDRLAAKLHG